MATEEIYEEDEFIINLTIDGTEFEEVEVKVTDPNKTIRDQITSIVSVFELPKIDNGGNPIQYLLGQIMDEGEEPEILEFEDEKIREVFDKFYGAHPDTKTDFIIRIDAEQRKYELALYRYGLKEPQIIPEDVYQLLVFKNQRYT